MDFFTAALGATVGFPAALAGGFATDFPFTKEVFAATGALAGVGFELFAAAVRVVE